MAIERRLYRQVAGGGGGDGWGRYHSEMIQKTQKVTYLLLLLARWPIFK